MSFANLIENVRVRAPGVIDDAIHLELFNVIDGLHRTQSLPIAAPSGSVPTAWLTTQQYADYQQLLLDGVIARLLIQTDKPYSNPELSQVHYALFTQEVARRDSRASAASAFSGTSAAGLADNIRQQVPGVRDEEIDAALFNVVTELAFTDLPITSPDRTASVDTWLTTSQWVLLQPTLLAGVIGSLLIQTNKPYSNPQLGAVRLEQFRDLIWRARQDLITEQPATQVVQMLLDNLRLRLPSARDGVISLELFTTIDEFCRHTDAYRQIVDIPLTIGETSYSLDTSGAVVVRVFSIAHPTMNVWDVLYDMIDRQILLPEPPQAFDAAEPLTLEVSLTADKATSEIADWLPAEAWERFHHAFLEGTLGRMHGQVAKPYSDRQKAAYHLSRFRRKMLEYRHDAAVGFAPGGQTWSFPRFAR